MDVNPAVVFQYVIPAIIAALAAAMIGIIPYFMVRRETLKEKRESDKTTVETARLLYEGLAQRVTQLETENTDLRRQHDMLRKENALMIDVQAAKYQLEQHVDELSCRIETLERTLKVVIDAFRKYIENPGIDGGDQMIAMLKEIEGQTKI